jgi:Tol biopolymer transport system component
LAGKAELQRKLKAGIEAAQQGDKRTARNLLKQVLAEDENNELAWMWLASAVETLDERRSCLQKVLQINPKNARAKEALSRLQAGGRDDTNRRAVDRLRKMNTQTSSAAATRQGFSLPGGYILVGAVVVIALIVALIFGGVFLQQTTTTQQATPDIEALFNPTTTPSPDPDTFTATPFFGVIVTVARDQSVFPPTFTPSPPATATVTLTPSATPYPLTEFSLIYPGLNAGEAIPGLYRIDGEGGNEQTLGGSDQGFTEAVYSPDGNNIAFVRTVTYQNTEGTEVTTPEMFIAPVDDVGAARQVTQMSSDLLSGPTWGPSGIELMFTSNRDGDEEIWYITEDGNNLRQITNNEEVVDRDPAWAPDNSRILFVSDLDSPGLTEIYSMSLDGSGITRLTNDTGSSYAPSWAPDASRVTFVSDRGGDGDVYVMDPDGQRPFLLTLDDASAEDRAPVFTPDIQWVAFASNRESEEFQIYIVDLRGSVLRRITNNERDILSLDYHPELVLRLRQEGQ